MLSLITGLQIDGPIDEVNSPYPIPDKFKAFNFHALKWKMAMTLISFVVHLKRQGYQGYANCHYYENS